MPEKIAGLALANKVRAIEAHSNFCNKLIFGNVSLTSLELKRARDGPRGDLLWESANGRIRSTATSVDVRHCKNHEGTPPRVAQVDA